jgi:hypothetical protein
VHHGTRAAPSCARLPVGPMFGWPAGESPITDAYGCHPGPVTPQKGEGSLMTPNAPPSAVDLGPDAGRMLSTHIVESGVPLAVFGEPSAGSPKS